MRYLAHHAAPALDPPTWLDVQSRTVEDTQPIRITPGNGFVSAETIVLAETIRETWQQGESKNKMAQMAGFPQYGGSYKGKIDRAIEYCEQYFSTTTTPNTPLENGEGQEIVE